VHSSVVSHRFNATHLVSSTIVPDIALHVEEHPLLRVAAFTTTFAAPLGATTTPRAALDALRLDASAPLQRDESVRGAVRDLLRHGGYKPTGRGKPASEYLVRAATEGTLGPINAAVDACNAVSLHSGFPISVVDLDRAHGPFRVAIAPEGASYVFNASAQEIDLGGLLCLFDAEGPCANAVRDSQRTKTRDETRATLSVIWGSIGHEARLTAAEQWYRALLEDAGARTEPVTAG
jgi:DNA/RNA-binding domain of Phe-tRNA-synthetase-like protein